MNKKQGIIIATLLALIVCAGVLATKLNSPLYVNGSGSSGTSTVSFNNSTDKTKATTDYFADTKLSRNQKDAQTLQTLKALIDDKNVSTANRDDAAQKYTKIAMDSSYEEKIESTLKAKGFENAVCSIEDTKARVIVKSSTALNDKQTRDIKNVVVSIAKINDVEIETKQ